MRISILCPTKGRIKRARLMRDSALITAERPRDLEFVFYVDPDDEETVRKSHLLLKTAVQTPTLSVQIIVNGEDINLSEKWNVCWKYASGDIFMLAGDDLIFRSSNWDKAVIDHFLNIPDRIAYIFPHDGYRGFGNHRGFGTHGFVHKNWTDVLGYFSRPYFAQWYTDTWFNYVSKNVLPGKKRHIGLQKVLVEHMHWRYGKSKKDQTYIDQRSHHGVFREVWENTQGERLADAAKLRRFIEEFNEGNSDKPAE